MIQRPERLWRPSGRPSFQGPALLDTHIWIWYLDGRDDLLPSPAVELLRRCARGEGLVISDISVWEVGTKVAKGKLALAPDVSAWLAKAERRPGFSFLRLDREILLSSTKLEGEVHGDPADRMLIASGMLARLPLVTADSAILDYAVEQGGFEACDARS